MNNNSIIINFNKKIVSSFLFVLVIFLAGVSASIFLTEGDNKHSAFFYNFGGIYLALFSLPFLLSYGKCIFGGKVAFYFDNNTFIYNNPLVDIPNPIFWKQINNIKEIELDNNKFIAISFYDNSKYIGNLNLFWKYMSNFRLKKFGYPLLINNNDMIDVDFETLVNIFYEKYASSKK